MPVPVSFLVASAVALAMNFKRKFNDRLETYLKGMGNSGIMMMCLIFILAGVFASLAKSMGAIDATVALGVKMIPANILIAGVFLIGCFISFKKFNGENNNLNYTHLINTLNKRKLYILILINLMLRYLISHIILFAW